jgi:L-ascorbate metabolism protein UlaG (beta-lactamase superfamily)
LGKGIRELQMKITWLGHSGFRFDIGDQVLLVDPWLQGNPVFPAAREAEHGDHFGDVVRLAQATGAKVYAGHEIADTLDFQGQVKAVGFARGGTITLGSARISMVPASHSSSFDMTPGNMTVAGAECGFMIGGEGHMIYITGDTGIMADMGWMGEYYKPDIGILCAGGHYTMDMDMAAWAAKRYFQFKSVIPCHYKTFGLLAQSADALVAGLPGVDVRVPGVMEPMEWEDGQSAHQP